MPTSMRIARTHGTCSRDGGAANREYVLFWKTLRLCTSLGKNAEILHKQNAEILQCRSENAEILHVEQKNAENLHENKKEHVCRISAF